MYGNEYGTGYCRSLTNPGNYYYERLTQFRDMNFMVCKIGTNSASAIGDIILVPFTQDEGLTSGVLSSYYKPGRNAGGAPLTGFYNANILNVAACV